MKLKKVLNEFNQPTNAYNPTDMAPEPRYNASTGVRTAMQSTTQRITRNDLIGLTKSTAKELAPRGITCNAVAPGLIQSKMTEVLPTDVKENYLKNIALGRFGTPEDVANVVAFLASEDSNYVTGQVFDIDGGLVM